MKTETTNNLILNTLAEAARCSRCANSEERYCSNCCHYDWRGYCSDGTPVSPSYYCSSHSF